MSVFAALTDAGVGLAEICAPEFERVIADIESSDSVIELEISQRYGERVHVQFETTMPLLLFPVRDSGVSLTMPFTIENGRADWEITVPRDRLFALGEFGIPSRSTR